MYRLGGNKRSIFSKRRRRRRSAAAWFATLPLNPRVLLAAAAGVLALAAVVIAVIWGISGAPKAQSVIARQTATPTGTALPSATAKPTPSPTPQPTPFVVPMRLLFSEKHINQPVYWDGQLLFSAGTGSPDTPVLRSLILKSIETGDETVVATSRVEYGEIYEPQLSEKWIIWLDTDHGGTSIIWALERGKPGAEPFQIKTCRNGKPKLRLSGETLVWMEPVSNEEDKLYLFDLASQENLPLTTLNAPSTYGVSAPSICNEQILWAGPDEKNPEQSVIYSFKLDDDHGDGDNFNIGQYRPGMYVHEPVANARAMAWIDTNKSPNAKLYFALDNGKPVLVDEGISTYAMGEGFLVYGKDEQVWVYSWATGKKELCSLAGQKAILPSAYERFIIWFEFNATENRDVVRMAEIPQAFIGTLAPTASPSPKPTRKVTPAPTQALEGTAAPTGATDGTNSPTDAPQGTKGAGATPSATASPVQSPAATGGN